MENLPLLTRLIAATLLAKQNQVLIAEIAYLRAEIAYLRDQLPKDKPLRFTDRWRKRLARAAAGVGWKRLAEIATVAKGSTIRGWHRLMLKGKLGVQKAGPGRKLTDPEIEKTVIRLAQENPTWGQKRIQGELLKLEICLSARTIGAILDRHGLKPAPKRSTDWSWKKFMAEKAGKIVATDFFTVEIPTLFGKRIFDVLFAIHVESRQVKIVGITEHSKEAYMMQTARNLTADNGWLNQIGAKYLIHDRDGKFCAAWQGVLKQAGIETVAIPARSPNLNAFAERWVRTVKRELVRQAWFLTEGSLRHFLAEYVTHYNQERPHQGKGNRTLPTAFADVQAPAQQSVDGFKTRQVRRITRCGGLINHYERKAA